MKKITNDSYDIINVDDVNKYDLICGKVGVDRYILKSITEKGPYKWLALRDSTHIWSNKEHPTIKDAIVNNTVNNCYAFDNDKDLARAIVEGRF